MKNLVEQIVELIRLTSTDMPADVESAILRAREQEVPASPAQDVMNTIVENISLARKNVTPVCQDTGSILFSIKYPGGWSPNAIRSQVLQAVKEATRRYYLRPNAVETITGKNTGDNRGDLYYPYIVFEEREPVDDFVVNLMLKGGGCENVGAQYRLPDTRLDAGRDLAGVKKTVLDAVFQAQGKGCAPGILGVGIGGDRGTSFLAAKEALWRRLDDHNPIPELAALEDDIFQAANSLEIGPMGFGGKTTILGVKIAAIHRIPASYFVSISYMCWAYRRRRMTLHGDQVSYE